jgi:hypothetical protein
MYIMVSGGMEKSMVLVVTLLQIKTTTKASLLTVIDLERASTPGLTEAFMMGNGRKTR